MKKSVLGAGATVLLLVALSHPAGVAAHGNTDLEQDPCMRQAGESLVHFSAYQPQYEEREQYCTDIPQAGETFLVVDLDPTLRAVPVGLRVVKGHGRHEADEQVVVADVRPSTHPDGVLRSEVRLDEGLYTVTIASEDYASTGRPQYRLRVQMVDYPKLVLPMVGPFIGLLLMGWLTYKLIRSRWLQRFWAAPSA